MNSLPSYLLQAIVCYVKTPAQKYKRVCKNWNTSLSDESIQLNHGLEYVFVKDNEDYWLRHCGLRTKYLKIPYLEKRHFRNLAIMKNLEILELKVIAECYHNSILEIFPKLNTFLIGGLTVDPITSENIVTAKRESMAFHCLIRFLEISAGAARFPYVR